MAVHEDGDVDRTVVRRGAIVLGGGRSTRMGMNKLTLEIDGASLLERAVAAALGWAKQVVVAGDEPEGWEESDGVRFRREDPPFGGPSAGISAALAALPDADEILILAGDLAHPVRTVEALAAAEPGPDGVVLVDEEGWPQYLAGRYRGAALRAEIRGPMRGVSVRRLMRGLDLATHPASEVLTRDLDNPEVAKMSGAYGPNLRC